MKKFMVSVLLDESNREVMSHLQSEENRIVGGWREQGIMLSIFFRADESGLFGVMKAESADAITALMSGLPFYQYMTIDIVEVKG